MKPYFLASLGNFDLVAITLLADDGKMVLLSVNSFSIPREKMKDFIIGDSPVL